jgi:hypothetical protein
LVLEPEFDGKKIDHLMKNLPTAVGSMFIDSGAHGLYNMHAKAKGVDGYNLNERTKAERYKFYTTPEFYAYCDAYAGFLKDKAMSPGVDLYVNVDAIFNPELSYKALKYLENEHGLKPIPVIHYNTPLKWVAKHLEEGYKFIGLGGLGQDATSQDYMRWADQVYDLICGQKSRMPLCRTHGFAMTSWRLMRRYPWWSVDSATWIKLAAYGRLYIPHRRNGKFNFEDNPYMLMVSDETNFAEYSDIHLFKCNDGEQEVVRLWLKEIGVPWGSRNGDKVVEGITTSWAMRAKANLLLFERFRLSLPDWPWAFLRKPSAGFGLLRS